jgi:hypothetical protein
VVAITTLRKVLQALVQHYGHWWQCSVLIQALVQHYRH